MPKVEEIRCYFRLELLNNQKTSRSINNVNLDLKVLCWCRVAINIKHIIVQCMSLAEYLRTHTKYCISISVMSSVVYSMRFGTWLWIPLECVLQAFEMNSYCIHSVAQYTTQISCYKMGSFYYIQQIRFLVVLDIL